MKTIFISILMLAGSIVHAQSDFDWLELYDHDFDDYGTAIEVDDEKSIYFAGYTGPFNSPTRGYFIHKMDSNGVTLWEYDGDVLILGDAGIYELEIDSLKNVYGVIQVQGSAPFMNDTLMASDGLFLFKLSPTGIPLWYQKLSDASLGNGFYINLETTAGGDCYVAGNYYNQVVHGSDTHNSVGSGDVFFAKIDSTGNFEWSKTFGGAVSCDDPVYGVELDGAENIFFSYQHCGSAVVPRFIEKYDPSGNLIRQIQLPSFSNLKIGINNYFVDKYGTSYISGYQTENQVIIGNDTLTNVNGNSYSVIKYDSTGTYMHGFVVVDTTNSYDFNPTKIYADSASNVYLIGKVWNEHHLTPTDTIGPQELFIVSYDLAENLRWAKGFANGLTSSTHSRIRDIQVAGDDIYTICNVSGSGIIDGQTINSSNGFLDILLGKVCKFNAPVSNFGFTIAEPQVTFTDSSLYNFDWYWDFGDGDTSTLQNPTHTYLSSGTFNVCLTVGNACTTVTYCDSVTIIGLSTNENGVNNTITVSPNPFIDYTTITFNRNEDFSYDFELVDLSGKIIMATSNIATDSFKLYRNDLAKGVYIYRIVPENTNTITGKLIVQ